MSDMLSKKIYSFEQ